MRPGNFLRFQNIKFTWQPWRHFPALANFPNTESDDKSWVSVVLLVELFDRVLLSLPLLNNSASVSALYDEGFGVSCLILPLWSYYQCDWEMHIYQFTSLPLLWKLIMSCVAFTWVGPGERIPRGPPTLQHTLMVMCIRICTALFHL